MNNPPALNTWLRERDRTVALLNQAAAGLHDLNPEVLGRLRHNLREIHVKVNEASRRVDQLEKDL